MNKTFLQVFPQCGKNPFSKSPKFKDIYFSFSLKRKSVSFLVALLILLQFKPRVFKVRLFEISEKFIQRRLLINLQVLG
ncbi:hypothetical protein AKJ56_02375 [candidate division MSBL1 archaeon SCGC-AAA382N08]|uniref:Uncharacterized protein n=1 Tax=candidate division MSBL1 archaeon SCGC-AAA382N08 TaxID=1698285 RepID=A0A133VMU9_9EURY|nr:hypothetical protein AKJ56_02375 [candidate division MSBL1 archaeon SCGC-AAA382N08]